MGKIGVYFSKGIVARILREGRSLTRSNVDVPNPAELMKTKRDAIARFIHVMIRIRDLYQLPPTSVHVFCDLAGSTIAFNRNASIFVNLRYYEAWRTYTTIFLYRMRSSGFEQMTT